MEPRIRRAERDDARGIAIVHVEAWQRAYRGLIDQEVLDGLSVENRTAGWVRALDNARPGGSPRHSIVVADIEGTVAGWAAFGAGRDEGLRHLGELSAIYVHPGHWSSGVGHELLAHAETELSSAGWEGAYLWVLEGNARAIGFYERHGWGADGASKYEEIREGHTLHELRYHRRLP